MPDIPQLLWTTALWGVVAAVAAAAIGGWLTRTVKISEFRQAWINDLRKDIADYVGAAQRWFRKYEELNDLDPTTSGKADRERKELFPITNKSRVMLWRIKLRFNPHDNRYKTQDDTFLQSLDDLLNPGKLVPPQLEASWSKLADQAVEQGRVILKREWEVTKKFRPSWF